MTIDWWEPNNIQRTIEFVLIFATWMTPAAMLAMVTNAIRPNALRAT